MPRFAGDKMQRKHAAGLDGHGLTRDGMQTRFQLQNDNIVVRYDSHVLKYGQLLLCVIDNVPVPVQQDGAERQRFAVLRGLCREFGAGDIGCAAGVRVRGDAPGLNQLVLLVVKLKGKRIRAGFRGIIAQERFDLNRFARRIGKAVGA